MNNKSKPYNAPQADSEELNIKQLVEQYAFYWRWFVVSIVLAFGAAILYLRYAEKVYSVNAKILLQDEKSSTGELSGLSELASFNRFSSTSAFVQDQMDVLRSRRILRKVVEEKSLNVWYFSVGNVKAKEILAKDAPVRLITTSADTSVLDSLSYKFNIIIRSSSSFDLKDEHRTLKNLSFGQKFASPLGDIIIVPGKMIKRFVDSEYQIMYSPINRTIDFLIGSLQMAPNKDEQSYVVNLSMEYPLKEKAMLIINTLIDKYNDDVSYDKNQVVKATANFINSRLELISKDLADADRTVADYKDNNRLVDMANEAQLYLQTATDNERKLVDAQTQLQLAEMMRDAIQPDNFSLLPSNIGLQDASIEATIVNYNKMILERDDLLKSATPDNPVVKNLNDNLKEINKTLRISLENYTSGLQLKVSSLVNQQSKFLGKLGDIPNQERGFKNISRQQQIVESIYLFLLQKREEAEIKASARPANLKVI